MKNPWEEIPLTDYENYKSVLIEVLQCIRLVKCFIQNTVICMIRL